MLKNELNAWCSNNISLDVFMRDAPIMAYSTNGEGVFINVSTMWANKLQHSPTELIGRQSGDFLTPKSHTYTFEKIIPILQDSGRLENVDFEFMAQDGTVIPVTISVQCILESGKMRTVVFAFDRTPITNLRDVISSLKSIPGDMTPPQMAHISRVLNRLEALTTN
jgi:PAS domain S-box-containing protein